MPQQNLGRSWGTRFDSLTATESLPSNLDTFAVSERATPTDQADFPADGSKRTHDRVVHDASIFIGSLPSNINHSELTSMLSQHLSEHPEVQSIKVVRDTKGGTCAFIQCQDANTATTLISDLHTSTPRQFMGRYLRYEPARAFRTLLVSYRSPKQYLRPTDGARTSFLNAGEEGKIVELELPTAMRILKTPGTKQLGVFYNSDATTDPPRVGVDDSILLLMPLLYDVESLMRITSAFGPVEYFGPVTPELEDVQGLTGFPVPHNGPRSAIMDSGCWEVKWAHRDDCVGALMTLRRVPHLTVTWAHQSGSGPWDQRPYHNARPAFTGPDPHLWRPRNFISHGPSRFLPPSQSFPDFRASENLSLSQRSPEVGTVGSMPSKSSSSSTWEQKITTVAGTRTLLPSRPRALSLTHDRPQSAISLASRESTGKLSSAAWETMTETHWADHLESVEIQRSTRFVRRLNHERPNSDLRLSAVNPTPISSPVFTSPQAASADIHCHASQADDGQEIETDIPPTPEFGLSPITPKTPGSLMLRTPTTASYMGDFQSMSYKDFDCQSALSRFSRERRDDAAVDPMTVFVGGLEMFGPNAWDEDKVRALFLKYGGVETVKVIRPTNKRSAFAFVKFNNTDSPARAISEEHNRVLDGRPIRVQLRDWNPPHRSSWRHGRGNERTYLGSESSLVSSDDFRVDSNIQRPGIINITGHIGNLKLTDALADNVTQPSPAEADRQLNEFVNDEARVPHLARPAEGTAHDRLPVPAQETPAVQIHPDGKQGEPAPRGTTTASPAQNSGTPSLVLPASYPLPAIAYYQGWVPGYGPQFPYQGPFTGQPYPGYPFPQPYAPPFPQGSGSDGGGTPASTPVPFGPPGGTFAAFTPYPTPSIGQPRAESHGAVNNATNPHTQAPLMPTGFIQGDQGMLVPVYPPDALNQYMSGTQDTPVQAPPNSFGSTETQSSVAWRPFPSGTALHPQAVIMQPYLNSHALPPPTPHQMGPHGWLPGHPWHGMQGVPSRQFVSSPATGAVTVGADSNFERNLPPRRQFRRDNQAQYHKNNFSRGPTGRFPRGSFSSSRSPSNTQPALTPQTGGVSQGELSAGIDWQHWSAT
ncbi:hypothetical protein HYDPIDRAFT_26694 [Hydnomerulius pinastri MD-312]|nr:hypothetical protein HYDPIDRAFT_26694 [Hydnomerulius pinastri MD-312]